MCADAVTEAARCVIVEAEEIVEVGEIKPEEVHLPGLYVNRLFKGAKFEHKIEMLKFSEAKQDTKDDKQANKASDPRQLIAAIAAQEFTSGMNCNLGGEYFDPRHG